MRIKTEKTAPWRQLLNWVKTQAHHCRRLRTRLQAPSPPLNDGAQAEALAARYLSQHGLRILAHNVHCRGGEIDLIALDQHTLVFVEVRLRHNPRYGGAAASVTPHKQARIRLAAQHWLQTRGQGYADLAARFDVLLFDRLDTTALTWLKAAFT